METSELFKRMNLARQQGNLMWVQMNRELNRRGWVKDSHYKWTQRK